MGTNSDSFAGRVFLGVTLLICVVSTGATGPLELDWTAVIGELRHISVGPSGVWGVHFDGRVFYREESRDHDGSKGVGEWVVITDKDATPHERLLQRLDVGSNIVWGVDVNGTVFVRMGIDCQNPTGCWWVEVPRKMVHVSVTPEGNVWATDHIGCIWRRIGSNRAAKIGDYWEKIEGSLAQISVGGAGVWGINGLGNVFYREGTYYDSGTAGTSWTYIPELVLKEVSVGHDKVWGIGVDGTVYYRAGLSFATAPGLKWIKVEGDPMETLDVWAGCVWALGPFTSPNIYGRLTSEQLDTSAK